MIVLTSHPPRSGFSVFTIHLGFDIWRWEPPKAAIYFIYAWSGFLLFVYVAGFALNIPKEHDKEM
jgi:hypothetical protein